ncbi:peptidase [Mesobacillus campisalis]|uniref:Peptidase n=1 Tax=Mesobacillus campisalis TaxID=1408103 RepID=A0A0M2SQB1_9BACI|nr:S9 family peptidase [Mesobacillus campisalis]KKK36428.1 peptidase [Mesobacillus campisalis]
MESKKLAQPEDLLELKSVTDPQMSPDGKKCAYVQTEIVKGKNDYASNLYILDLAGNSGPKQWTFGNVRNHSPKWSPDGTKLAFVSTREGKAQVFVLEAGGGEARKLTSCPHGASGPIWSPDSRRIAFSAHLKPGEELISEKEEDKEKKQPEPLVVDKMKYKSDSAGFWDGTYKQAAVVDVATRKTVLLTKGECDSQADSWSPDGEWVAVSGNPNKDQDLSFLSDIRLIQIESGNETVITNGGGYFGDASFSPDGKYLGYLGHEREFENATLVKLWLYELETGITTCVTDGLDIHVGDAMVGDFQQGAKVPGILWGKEGSFYFLASDNGNTVIYYGNVNGEVYPALLDDQHVYGMSLDPRKQEIVAAISRPSLPGELFKLEVTTGQLKQLTAVNEAHVRTLKLSEPERIQFGSSDGLNLHGWLLRPTIFREGEKYPLVVEIHGGPHAMYGNTYFQELQVLAAKGYAVLYINPRGSHGYGQDFVDAVRGDYGGGDYEDIMAAVDYALQTYSFLDGNRLGVTGGSYGGFMTNWIVGHSTRFKAAVTQRSISNWISFYGVSDIGYYFTEWQIKADLENLDKLWKHSPIAYVDKIQTPLLILHSEKDYRCPIEQAEQLFIALKRQGKKARLIRFPESNHELSRSGKPDFRLQRLEYIAGWFEENLK